MEPVLYKLVVYHATESICSPAYPTQPGQALQWLPVGNYLYSTYVHVCILMYIHLCIHTCMHFPVCVCNCMYVHCYTHTQSIQNAISIFCGEATACAVHAWLAVSISVAMMMCIVDFMQPKASAD